MKKILLFTTLISSISLLSQAQVGIGTTDPKSKLHVLGNLQVAQETQVATNNPPTTAQTKTMVGSSSTTYTPSDLTGRIYDPGGPTGNYLPGMTAEVLINSGLQANIAVELTIESIDLGSLDSLIVMDEAPANNGNVLLAVGHNYNTPGNYVFNTRKLYIIFKSNTDASVGAGFSLLYKRVQTIANSPAVTSGSGYAGNVLFFDATKGALRSGSVSNNGDVGNYSIAAGSQAVASGNNAVAFGNKAKATGNNSFAAGNATEASGVSSMALGDTSTASGYAATALNRSYATGDYSLATGYSTVASGAYSTTMGNISIATADYALAAGFHNTASGQGAVAMGQHSVASGNNSIALGDQDTASGDQSVALGNQSKASGTSSIAMGDNTKASAGASTALGKYTTASGNAATAMGNTTTASGGGSTSMGYGTTASGSYSTAMGLSVTAQAHSSLVIGRYNIITGSSLFWTNTDPLFVAGNGNGASPSNALTLYKNGNLTIAGTLTQSSDIRLKKDIKQLDNSLEKIAQLHGYHYHWKKDNADARLQSGVIAQEVQKVMPELVTTDDNGDLTVNYNGITPYLIEGMKEQQKTIEEMKILIDKLNSRIVLLENEKAVGKK